jgi:hypothetical protein
MVTGDPARKLSYGELIGGRYFDQPMAWNGKIGNDLVAAGQAKPKPPSAYKVVGQSPPRFDVPAKVFGKLDYVTDIKVPGMLHGRMIRPPVAGALPVAVDDGSVRDLPGVHELSAATTATKAVPPATYASSYRLKNILQINRCPCGPGPTRLSRFFERQAHRAAPRLGHPVTIPSEIGSLGSLSRLF